MKSKILCVCQKGNSRSVACAYLLKKKYGVDAIACEFKTQSIDTINMLCDWADKIILMAPQYRTWFYENWIDKLFILNVGHDTYFRGHDSGLLSRCDDFIKAKIIKTTAGSVGNSAP